MEGNPHDPSHLQVPFFFPKKKKKKSLFFAKCKREKVFLFYFFNSSKREKVTPTKLMPCHGILSLQLCTICDVWNVCEIVCHINIYYNGMI